MTKDGMKHLSPELQKLLKEQEGMRWLFMDRLKPGDTLEVHTKNSTYTMKVGACNRVTVTTSKESTFPMKDVVGSVLGSTLTGTGTMLKIGGIAIGVRICLFLEGKGEIILTPTEKVFLNGEEVTM